MNQGLHRVIFNAARGLRMVVAETASSTGKGGNAATDGRESAGWRSALFAIGWSALAAISLVGGTTEAHAQIVPNPFAAAGQKPQVLVAPNGVPLVNITTPSAAGVSINQYNQFDVNAAGAILNNSRTTASTQLGGLVQGNPWLATGPARIIVNQVTSSNPSYLNGYIEVAGQRAEVIIANPSGINVNGGGFINTSRATLTTGTPQYGAMGTLDSFLVQGGTVTINGNGLDLSTTDYAAILSRALQVNAAIYASELKVVTGANQVSADHAQVTPTAGTGTAPTFALDVSALGGMYAKKITLIGTEAGLGVRNAGSIGASAGNLVVTAAGRLENTGTLEGQSVQLASTGGDIDNRGGTIRQTSTASLAIAAPTLSNTNGGWIGTEPLSVGTGAGTGTTGSTGGTGAAPTGTTGTTGSTGSGSGSGSTGATATAAPAAPPDPGAITAAGAILNDGGKIYAGGPITLQSPNIVNTGGTLSVANMALNQQSFSNHGGTLNVSGNFSANVGSFDNSTGTVRAGNLNIATTGDLINVDGTLTSDSTATLNVGGKVDNTRGTIAATNTLAANVAGATDNTAGTLAANQGVQLATASLTNDKGAIQASAGPVQLTVTGALNNGQGSIGAGTDLTIQAGSLANASGGGLRATHDVQVTASGALTNAGSITAGRNTTLSAGSVQSTTGSVLGAGIQADGSLASTGDLHVAAANASAANGTNLAAGNASLQGASVDVGSGATSAANIALTATSGNVTTSGAKVVTPGTLSVTANSNAGQTLVNNAGALNAGQLQINASNIANTNGGEIVQTGTAATSLAVSGTLNNDGGRIASNSQDLALSGASITNTGGRIEHAGTGTLAIGGGSFSGTNGQITGNGALAVNLSGGFSQDGGTTYADQITVQAGSLSNQGGSIVQGGTGATQISVTGAANNNGGTLATNGTLALGAASLSNQGGTLQSGTGSDLTLTVSGPLDNSQSGKVISGANASVQAGSLNNDTGRITAVGDLTASVAGAASNQDGTLAANGNTTVNAASLNNNGGTTAAVNGALAVTTSGATTNAGGTLQAGGTTTLSNAGLDNSAGRVFGDSVAVDTHGQQLSNGHGRAHPGHRQQRRGRRQRQPQLRHHRQPDQQRQAAGRPDADRERQRGHEQRQRRDVGDQHHRQRRHAQQPWPHRQRRHHPHQRGGPQQHRHRPHLRQRRGHRRWAGQQRHRDHQRCRDGRHHRRARQRGHRRQRSQQPRACADLQRQRHVHRRQPGRQRQGDRPGRHAEQPERHHRIAGQHVHLDGTGEQPGHAPADHPGHDHYSPNLGDPAPVPKGANSFDTGSLTMTNVTNTSSYDGSGWSVTVGNSSTPSAGYGSVSGGQTGVSVAGISGIAGNSGVRTGDPSGGVRPGPSTSSILSDVNAQVQITNTASGLAVEMAWPVLNQVWSAISSVAPGETNSTPSQKYENLKEAFELAAADPSLSKGEIAALAAYEQFLTGMWDKYQQQYDKAPSEFSDGLTQVQLPLPIPYLPPPSGSIGGTTPIPGGLITDENGLLVNPSPSLADWIAGIQTTLPMSLQLILPVMNSVMGVTQTLSASSNSGQSAGNVPPLPTGLVGDQTDPRAGVNPSGGKNTSGELLPQYGGTGNFLDDLERLTGGTRPWQPGDKAPPGSLVGANGIFGRPNTSGGFSIDIPANGNKPHETLHYPK